MVRTSRYWAALLRTLYPMINEPPTFSDPAVARALGEHAELLSASHFDGFPGLMTIKEAALFLNVHHSTIRRWERDGTLAAVRPGPRTVRIRRADLLNLLRPSRT